MLDLDDPDPAFVQPAEVVYCYGTLYHLRRPAEALAYLAERCDSLLLLETCVAFGEDERLEFVKEWRGNPSHSVSGTGCRPTRLWVRRRLERQFEHVYVPVTQPWHPEFPVDWTAEPSPGLLVRAVFVASRTPLDNPILSCEIPHFQRRA
jgi:hypothetical protein